MPDPNKLHKCVYCGDITPPGFDVCFGKECLEKKKIDQELRPWVRFGAKLDSGKQPYYAMPLVVLKPLADVYAAGEKKYATFNCLQPFEDGDRRFWDAIMRHLESCQIDPLAKDEETGCYHLAQVAFNALHRLYNAMDK
jgi:hypothetical protein